MQKLKAKPKAKKAKSLPKPASDLKVELAAEKGREFLKKTSPLNEVQQRWLDGLRKGRWKKVVGELHEGHKVCVMGAAYMAIQDKDDPTDVDWWNESEEDLGVAIGLTLEQIERMVTGNDVKKMSFKKLADRAEAYLLRNAKNAKAS